MRNAGSHPQGTEAHAGVNELLANEGEAVAGAFFREDERSTVNHEEAEAHEGHDRHEQKGIDLPRGLRAG